MATWGGATTFTLQPPGLWTGGTAQVWNIDNTQTTATQVFFEGASAGLGGSQGVSFGWNGTSSFCDVNAGGNTGAPTTIRNDTTNVNGTNSVTYSLGDVLIFRNPTGSDVGQLTITSSLLWSTSSGSGSTQTYIRTTHTGTILNSTQNRINPPDLDHNITVAGLLYNEDYFFRKIGNYKFRLRWHDQNEAPTYVCSCYVETSPNVYDQYTLGVSQGSGDVQWDLDTSNGSGQIVNGVPSTSPVMHNGKVYITFGQPVYFEGNYIPAGDTVKEWTYLGVGPYKASFTPRIAKEGEQVSLGFEDLNPAPDTPQIGSYIAPDGTTANIDLAFGNPYTVQVSAQKGYYEIYESSTNYQASHHFLGSHKFVRGGKVSGNFW